MFNFCTKTIKKIYLCFCIYFSRNAIEQLRKDHDESIIRLKTAKDSQIEAVAISHDTTKLVNFKNILKLFI